MTWSRCTPAIKYLIFQLWQTSHQSEQSPTFPYTFNRPTCKETHVGIALEHYTNQSALLILKRGE
jgi:hypothetical protein